MGSVTAVVDLKSPSAAATCASPAMLFQHFQRIDPVHFTYQCFQRQILSEVVRDNYWFVIAECAICDLPIIRSDCSDLAASQTLGSLLGHAVPAVDLGTFDDGSWVPATGFRGDSSSDWCSSPSSSVPAGIHRRPTLSHSISGSSSSSNRSIAY
jgi:hypothetical protein